MEKSYRIHTNIINDTVLNVNMQQDYDFLEVLSLKLRTTDAYRLHSSNYGVIIGRVLANDAFGIPNAKVSVFIERDENDPTYIESIYPFTEIMDTDKQGRRYNLLPDYSNDDCYRIVGTFPNKRLVLDDNVNLEIYDKYWKFTTVTNSAGDYMIFGVPSGNQQIHVDIDLSDIGILSQTPRDFEHKGYNMTMFDSPNQFKESTNLDGLAQIFSQNKSVFVYPFWGDENLGNGIAAITRCDVQIQYKFEPTCVFMGAIMSDNEGNSIGHKCAPNVDNGMNYQLVAGEGTIEMIRKTTDGLIEEYSIQGNQLIDSNGVWCYQIPMNLDYIATDEYGNIVPTDNPNRGIPTRAQVRFRFSKTETSDEGISRHTAKYLVPMNPTLIDGTPKTAENGAHIEQMYSFGSSTPDDCFRDLYWNNVYSVKNYIPKVQVAHRAYAPNYTGLKGSNLAEDQNPVPFNKLRIDLPVVYVVVCILFGIVRAIVQIVNVTINMINGIIYVLQKIRNLCLDVGLFEICPFKLIIPKISYIGCVSLGGGLSPNNVAYYPACDSRGMNAADCPDDMENCQKSANSSELMDLVQQKLAEDYKIVKLDFYQDWLNGSLYMPLWYWRKRKKKKFLFVTISSAKNEFCDCDKVYTRLKSYVTCNIAYTNNRLGVSDGVLAEGENNWHRSSNRSGRVFITNGLIKGVENKDGLTSYYYSPIQPTGDAKDMPMAQRGEFRAFRLFATDIILLGNLNEDNLYGLPQFFKTLPSTTANIPPIASVEEAADDKGGGTRIENTLLADADDTGVSLVTGMDWIDGDGSPQYSDGLFMLLSCTYAHTKAKSCINVERLSELGMNLDMTYSAQYPSSTGLRYGTFEHDGFITKQELDDTDNRAMFATMNHLGFIPQPYQNKFNTGSSINFYSTQVLDENTHYYVPKFKFLYPTDLDGRLKPLLDRYRNGFKQVMSDDPNEDYINFRLGDVQSKNGIIRGGQFYLANHSMPLYNNSFYFYFGIKKGNTAIDKFNKMFYAQCFQNSKKPFSLKITTRPESVCKSIYKNNLGESLITVSSDDIEKPYSYELLDVNGDVVYGPVYDVESDSFEISGKPNATYTLRVTDINGRHMDENVTLSNELISISYTTQDLGTKYYDDKTGQAEINQRQEICSDTEFYGKVVFDSLVIDGYNFDISSATTLQSISPEGKMVVNVVAKRIEENEDIFVNSEFTAATLYFDLLKDETSPTTGDTTVERVEDCLCTNLDNYSFFTATTMSEDEQEKVVFGFDVYKPHTYMITLVQICDDKETTNLSSFAASIGNGNEFEAFINKTPINFLLNKGNDYYKPDLEHNFYPYLINWLCIHSEESLSFPEYGDKKIWEKYIGTVNDLIGPTNKRNVIKYKFERIFDLSNVLYVINDDNRLQYTAIGGVQPLLYRALAPNYSDEEKVAKQFIYSDSNSVTINPNYPNIVATNYQDGTSLDSSPRANQLYSEINRRRLGNYFMVATNNGRYVNSYSGDCTIRSYQIPSNAAVNVGSDWKRLGLKKTYAMVPEVIVSGGAAVCQSDAQPYFRAMTVDRRLDFNLSVMGPIFEEEIPSSVSYDGVYYPSSHHYGTPSIMKSKTVNIRFFGTIYNGVEMAYDNDYNIIAANREVDYTESVDPETGEVIMVEKPDTEKITPNYALEYTYQYGSGATVLSSSESTKVKTILSPYPTYENDYVWKDLGDLTNAIIKDKEILHSADYYNPANISRNQRVLKTYHTFSVNDIDARQLLWSGGNYQISRLARIATSSANTWVNNGDCLPFYLFNHSVDTNYYGNIYDNENLVIKMGGGEYPIKRYIDIGRIEATEAFSLKLSSCNYGCGLNFNEETNKFEATLNEGDNVGVEFTFGQNVIPSPRDYVPSITGRSESDEDYGHFLYITKFNYYGVNGQEISSFTSNAFSISNIALGVNYVENDYGNYEVYPLAPRLVTPNFIHYLKGLEDSERIFNEWTNCTKMGYAMVNGGIGFADKNDLPSADDLYANFPYRVNGLYIEYNNKKITLDGGYASTCRVGLSTITGGTHIANGVYSYIQSKGYDAKSFFIKEEENNKYAIVSTVKELVPLNDERNLKKIRVYEFSEFYNCKDFHVYFKFTDKSIFASKFYFKVFSDSANDAFKNGNVAKVDLRIRSCHNPRQWPGGSIWIIDMPVNFFYRENVHFIWENDNDELVVTTTGEDLQPINCQYPAWYGEWGPIEYDFFVTISNGAIYKFVFDFQT